MTMKEYFNVSKVLFFTICLTGLMCCALTALAITGVALDIKYTEWKINYLSEQGYIQDMRVEEGE